MPGKPGPAKTSFCDTHSGRGLDAPELKNARSRETVCDFEMPSMSSQSPWHGRRYGCAKEVEEGDSCILIYCVTMIFCERFLPASLSHIYALQASSEDRGNPCEVIPERSWVRSEHGTFCSLHIPPTQPCEDTLCKDSIILCRHACTV